MDYHLTEIKGYNLKLYQRKKGYRFSIDSFLLAHFVSVQEFKNALEIGAGSGVVSLLIERMTPDKKHFELVEIQQSLCFLLRKNIALNKPFKSEFTVRCEDANFILPSKSPDIVYSNPPFTDYRKGKVSPSIEKAIARHTYYLNAVSLLKWYVSNTDKHTRLSIVETIENLSLYLKEIELLSLFIEKIVYVKSFEKSEPTIFLLTLSKTKKNKIEDYLTIYRGKGIYTDKVKRILGIL